MFIRWKKRTRTSRWKPDGYTALSAVLVESQRTQGQPRQRTIKYLGAISEPEISYPRVRFTFWQKVAVRLDSLSLPPDARQRIEETIAATVPRTTEEDVIAARQRCDPELDRLEAAIKRNHQ